ncbi:T9SS type A sorting domain-containing protein, partial [Flavobacterium sp.]|uniref:T9SS type A sorting domain-containing protein n=1 Tax=Flavobacterium sp. TaxID=239 RepID=UPI0037506B2B
MKKITLFMFLMSVSFGFSQTLPFTFSNSNQLMLGDNCTTSLTTDAGNAVQQIIGGGQLYDNAQIVLASNVNLADDANNTITFRIKPVNGTGSGSHLLKFENGVGGPANTELPFTTTGTAWQNITINFGTGLGNFPKMVIFTDFNNSSVDTYLIDDIAGGTNIAPPAPLPTPPGPAPVPTLNPSVVVSMYGETYPNTYQYSFGAATDVDLDATGAVNNALKINLAVAGFGAGYNQTDVTTMQYVHFDYWTSDATTFGLYLISNTGEKVYRLPENQAVVLNAWTSVNIPMTYFTALGFNPVTWFQYKFDVLAATPGTVYFDNVYFSSSPLSTTQFDNVKVSMYPNPTSSNLTIEASTTLDVVSVFNLVGQEVIKINPNNNVSTIDVSNLQTGVYVVKTTSQGVTSAKRF